MEKIFYFILFEILFIFKPAYYYIYRKFPYLDLLCRFEQCLKGMTLFGMSYYLELHKSEAQRAQTLMTGGKTIDFSIYGEQWAFYCELYGILWITHNFI